NSLSGGIGGGVAGGILVNCTVVSNGVGGEGGLYAGVAKNSILYYNSGGNYNANLSNCCTLPLPASGIDNFTQPPLFVDLASADFADPDGDGMNNWQEWIAGTNPTDSSSGLWILTPSNNASGITITWQSVNTRTYYVQRATNLSSQPVFLPLSGYITGQSGTT